MRMTWIRGSLVALALLLSILVGTMALVEYVHYDPSTDTRTTVNFADHPVAVIIHAVGGSFAPLLGLLQWSTRLRRRRPLLHRWLGRLYLLGGVAIGGSAALWLSLFAYGGPLARTGFTALGVLWMAVSTQAYLAIRRGEIAPHRTWMMRSVALAFAAVTLRVYLPLLSLADVPFVYAYRLTAWGSWVPNLLIVELLLRRERTRRTATLSRLRETSPSTS